ncbi:NifB/NifX family molybdenum-iron cluster-binding protein [Thiolinea disciformis]|uniref:NifB/NifX family molybdenum-iron cluster-binding protein n=1 Tax=Thiolinea disciformis TaxID=125614 RepID=UPI00037DF030|nr:hypothetical protein [Thiolinea disciformis]
MKIGVSSQNFRTITGHAGKGRRFMIFEAELGQTPQEIERLDLPMDMSIHAWNGQSTHPLFSLDYLITAGCGEGFIRKLAAQGVHVKITDETVPMVAVQALMAGQLVEKQPETHPPH